MALNDDNPLPQGEVKPEGVTKVSSLNSWVQAVAIEYLNKDTFEFIKFCFEGDERIPHSELEPIDDFRNLFYFVRERRYANSNSETLGRFIYLLDEVCGHRRYGKRALLKLEDKHIEQPAPYTESEEPLIVQLHHCLSKIASRLSPDEEIKLRKHYAKDKGINPLSKLMATVLSLFRYLLHDKRITENDQVAFMHAMIACNAKSKLSYLRKYRERNSLSMIAYEPIASIESQKSSRTSSMLSSSRNNLDQVPRAVDPSSIGTLLAPGSPAHVTPNQSIPHQVPTRSIVIPERTVSEGAPVIRVSRPPASETSVTEQDPLLERRISPPRTLIRNKKGIMISVVCYGILFTLIVIFSVIVVATGYGLIHAAINQCTDTDVPALENSTIKLTSFSPYYVNKIDMSEKLQDKESRHKINFYLIDDCLYKENINTLMSSNFLANSVKNMPPLYLLPGSYINYNICALNPYADTRIEVFVLTNLPDSINFDPSKFPLYQNFHICSTRDEKKSCRLCNSFIYEVNTPDYYSVRFVQFPDHYDVMYNYTSEVRSQSIMTPPVNYLQNCSVVDDDQKCSFDIEKSLPHYMNREDCIIANVEPDEDVESNLLHIGVSFMCTSVPLIISGVFFGLGSVVLITLLLISTYFCVKHKRQSG